jgi:hypothetical protein
MEQTRGFVCWVVAEASRAALLASIPTAYAQVVCHHVTIAFDVSPLYPLPEPMIGYVVGEIMDKGVQALVVEIDGVTIRPDGERYHITFSLDDGRFAEEARRLVRRGWFPYVDRIPVELIPAFIPRVIVT